MGNVRRVYVEKKPDFAVKAKELKHEVKHYLGIAADQVRVLIRYDVENVSDATYQKALQTVFSEPPVDDIYEMSGMAAIACAPRFPPCSGNARPSW